jgi:hypothetical protein
MGAKYNQFACVRRNRLALDIELSGELQQHYSVSGM